MDVRQGPHARHRGRLCGSREPARPRAARRIFSGPDGGRTGSARRRSVWYGNAPRDSTPAVRLQCVSRSARALTRRRDPGTRRLSFVRNGAAADDRSAVRRCLDVRRATRYEEARPSLRRPRVHRHRDRLPARPALSVSDAARRRARRAGDDRAQCRSLARRPAARRALRTQRRRRTRLARGLRTRSPARARGRRVLFPNRSARRVRRAPASRSRGRALDPACLSGRTALRATCGVSRRVAARPRACRLAADVPDRGSARFADHLRYAALAAGRAARTAIALRQSNFRGAITPSTKSPGASARALRSR